jgi:hypothetical protein
LIVVIGSLVIPKVYLICIPHRSREEHFSVPAPTLTARALSAIDLKPGSLAELILGHLRAGTDLFSLPDLRASMAGQP